MRVRKTKFTCNDFSLGLQNFRGRVRFSEEDLVLSFTVDVLCSALVRAIVAAINGNDLQHYNFFVNLEISMSANTAIVRT